MKKIFIYSIFILAFLLCSCTNSASKKEADTCSTPVKQNTAAENPRTKYYDIYTLALDSFMPIDDGLNGGMQYIAIDTKTLKDATETDKAAIMKYFEKYNVKVIDESFDSLKAKGMVKDMNYIEGLLLSVKSIELKTDGEAIVEGSKFRSGLGAIGVKSTIKLENGKWNLKSSNMMWIS
jgi:hypothetical protein